MKEAQQIVSEKTSALEAEAYKNNRLQVGTYSLVRFVHYTFKPYGQVPNYLSVLF